MGVLKRMTAFVTGAVVGFAAFGTAQAQSVAEFYKGKQITLLVGTAAGGTYDVYARALARYIGKHIPGNPAIVVQNMGGAGGVPALNVLYKGAQDGTLIGATTRTGPFDPMLYDRKFEFDAQKLKWLGSLATETNVIITWHTAPVKTSDDLFKVEAIFAAAGATTDGVIYPKMINQWLGGKMKVVAGYAGSPEMMLAMERGEAHGRAGVPWGSVKQSNMDWIRDKKVNIVSQLALTKEPDLQDVPLILDYVKNPAHRAAFEMLFIRQDMGRPFLAPPDIPTDRLKALRAAFVATAKDPEFLAEAQKGNLDIGLRTGEEVQALVAKAYSSSKEAIDLIKNILKE